MVPMSPVCQADSLLLIHLRDPVLCQRHHQSTSSSEAQCQEAHNSWIGLQRGILEEQWKEESKGLLQKCLFLAQSHFSRWHRIPGSDVNCVQWQFSWYMLKYVTTCDEKFQDTSFMDEYMALKLLSECYNSDQKCMSCWVSPADTPSLVTGTFTLSSLDFSTSYGCSRNAAAASPMKMVSWEDIPSVKGPVGRSSLVSEHFVHEVSCLYVGDTAPPASCHHGRSLQNAGSWSRFWSWGSVLWEILDISMTTEPDILSLSLYWGLWSFWNVSNSVTKQTLSPLVKRGHMDFGWPGF